MKRISIAAAVVVAATALTAGPAAASAHPTTLKLRKTSVGTILVNGRGFTLYTFSRDTRGRDACAAISGCPGVWPAVSGAARPVLGQGVKRSMVGTIRLKSGAKQLTYGGRPLYTYVGDSGPGQTSYVNFFEFGGHWPAVNAAGAEVK